MSTASTRKSMVAVYLGYAFRYLYLLVLVPFYGRVLGPSAYGQLLAAMSLFQFVWMIVEWGLPTAGMREVAQSTRSPQALASLYGGQMSARLWLCLPATVLGAMAILGVEALRSAPLLGILAIVNGLLAAFNMGWFFIGTLRFTTSVQLELLGFAINLPLILLLVHGPADVARVMGVLVLSSLVCTVIAHGVLWRSLAGQPVPLRGGWVQLRDSTALFLQRGLAMGLASSTALVMGLFSKAAEVGIYGAADRLVGVGLSLLQPANQVLVGTVSRHLAPDGSRAEAHRMIRLAFFGIAGMGVLMAVVAWVMAPWGVRLIFGPGYEATVPILRSLALVMPCVAVVQVLTGQVLIPHHKDVSASVIQLVGTALTLGLILGWGVYWGGEGVAWARVVGQAAMVVASLWVIRRYGLLNLLLPGKDNQP